jgi:hypothetical protein
MTTTFTTPTLNSTSATINTFNTMYGPITIPAVKTEDFNREDFKFKFTDIKLKTNAALKFDDDKPPMNLLSREALEQTAKVMAFGKEKYDAHNWRKGFAWSRPLSAAMRHLMAFNDGEDKDPESGLSHLAHAACCIMFLLEFEKTHQELDDRFKPTEQ